MIDSGANANYVCNYRTPLLHACSLTYADKSWDLAKLLIENGADENSVYKDCTALMELILSYDRSSETLPLDFIKFLIDCGTDINFYDSNLGKVLKQRCSCAGGAKNSGSDVNKTDDSSFTALMHFCRNIEFTQEHLPTLILLIKNSTNIMCKSYEKKTAFNYFKNNKSHKNITNEQIEASLKGEYKFHRTKSAIKSH